MREGPRSHLSFAAWLTLRGRTSEAVLLGARGNVPACYPHGPAHPRVTAVPEGVTCRNCRGLIDSAPVQRRKARVAILAGRLGGLPADLQDLVLERLEGACDALLDAVVPTSRTVH